MLKRLVKTKRRTVLILLLTAGIGLAVLLYFFEPVKGGIFPPCPFLSITGLYCPGCGTLRGLHSIVHGDLLKALDHNILMVFSLPLVCYLYLAELDIRVKGHPLPLKKHFGRTFYTILITAVLLFWILRNINIFPLSLLAPDIS